MKGSTRDEGAVLNRDLERIQAQFDTHTDAPEPVCCYVFQVPNPSHEFLPIPDLPTFRPLVSMDRVPIVEDKEATLSRYPEAVKHLSRVVYVSGSDNAGLLTCRRSFLQHRSLEHEA